MNGKKVLGIIFANIHEGTLDSLTASRTMGSVPFCSRYRLIDFPLSNMVEGGVNKNRRYHERKLSIPYGPCRHGQAVGFKPQKRRPFHFASL